MESTSSSEVAVDSQRTARRYIPEHGALELTEVPLCSEHLCSGHVYHQKIAQTLYHNFPLLLPSLRGHESDVGMNTVHRDECAWPRGREANTRAFPRSHAVE
jgi:hypothetical protein